MLYKIEKEGDKYASLVPQGFDHLELEKDLENLLADHLMESLQLIPIFQERQRQEEADIYAINADGDLVIFELKRGEVGDDAVHQILRYSDISSDWKYDELQAKFNTYKGSKGQVSLPLEKYHQDVFELESPLQRQKFNSSQYLIIVGYSGNDSLIRKVTHWKQRGLTIDFSKKIKSV